MYISAPGIIALTLVTALIYLGFLHRVLDRMKLTKETALVILLLMLAGLFIPSIPLGNNVFINVGGALVPLGVCLYLLFTADTTQEKGRAVATALLVMVIVYLSDKILSIRPGGTLDLDPIYFPAVAAGIIAYVWGRSRRAAFIGGVLGVILLDLVSLLEIQLQGLPFTDLVIGAGGAFGTVVIAGMLAVLLAEVVGETRERLQGGPKYG